MLPGLGPLGFLHYDVTFGFLRDSKDIAGHAQPPGLPWAGLACKKCEVGKSCPFSAVWSWIITQNSLLKSLILLLPRLWALQWWKQHRNTVLAIEVFSPSIHPENQGQGKDPNPTLADTLWWMESLGIYTNIQTLLPIFLWICQAVTFGFPAWVLSECAVSSLLLANMRCW